MLVDYQHGGARSSSPLTCRYHPSKPFASTAYASRSSFPKKMRRACSVSTPTISGWPRCTRSSVARGPKSALRHRALPCCGAPQTRCPSPPYPSRPDRPETLTDSRHPTSTPAVVVLRFLVAHHSPRHRTFRTRHRRGAAQRAATFFSRNAARSVCSRNSCANASSPLNPPNCDSPDSQKLRSPLASEQPLRSKHSPGRERNPLKRRDPQVTKLEYKVERNSEKW